MEIRFQIIFKEYYIWKLLSTSENHLEIINISGRIFGGWLELCQGSNIMILSLHDSVLFYSILFYFIQY